MPRDRWNSSWDQFPQSRPIPVDNGIATTKKRGAMAESWWSQRFVDVLESYGLGGRMQRGRSYARKGQVVSLDMTAGLLDARVQGSRAAPYAVTIRTAVPSSAQWDKLEAAFRARVGFAARLLAGEVPPELEDAFAAVGVALFPSTWKDVKAHCSCPDWGDPCKHVAAVLYVVADQLDADPWRLLKWRGRSREQLFEHLRARGIADERPDHGLPPWWPLTPGTGTVGAHRVHASPALPIAEPADPPDDVLRRVEPLDVVVRGIPLSEVLSPVYAALASGELSPPGGAG